MRFFASASAVMALVSAAMAQTANFDSINKPLKAEVIPAGSVYTVEWTYPDPKYDAGTVSIHLIGGATDATLVPVADIAAGIPNSAKTYSWTVDASLGSVATYGLIIKLESDPSVFQYSNPFQIKAGAVSSASATATGAVSSVPAGVTITTAVGEVTVTLTSCPPSSTSTTSIYTPPPPPPVTTSAPCNTTLSTSVLPSSTKLWNTTSVVIPSPPSPPPATIVVPPPVSTQPAPVPTTAAPKPSAVPAGAARFYSGSALVFGGVAAALFL